MSHFVYRFSVLIGFFSLFHAAYSAAQHRSYLRLNDLEFISLPFDIIIQALLSLFVIMYGVLHVSGDFKEINASAELANNSWETFGNICSFYTFNHRCKLFTHFYNFRPNPESQYFDYLE